MGALWQDIQYALRMLKKAPGFTAVAVVTLALGIGANTAIFSVVNTVLLRSLPYPDADRIVNISRPTVGDTVGDSVPMFTFWQQNNPGFEDLSAYEGTTDVNLETGTTTELISAVKVSQNYFHLFGATPILGRVFTYDEDRLGGSRALLMSYGLWQSRFGGQASIVGKTITVADAPYTVIGVLSPTLKPTPPADVWIPLQADPHSTNQAHILTVSGRLASGTTLAQANAQMAVIGKRYAQMHPEQLGSDDNIRVVPMQERITNGARSSLFIMLGAVGLVLLIACANVANLLLAKAASRRKEIAIRSALGAGRGRIARQLLSESLVLAVSGGVLGLAGGSFGIKALLALAPGDLPRVQEMAAVPALDPAVAGFTVLLAVVTGVLFGLVPALQLSRTELSLSLRELGGPASSGPKHNRMGGTLMAAEVATAVMLLCGAFLLLRSFAAMHRVPLGFNPENLLTMEVSLNSSRYSHSSDVDRLAREFTERAEKIPGVEFAAMANSLPLSGRQDYIFDIPGRPRLKGYKFTGDVQWRFVSSHYFETLRSPLLSGRLLQERELGKSVVINQAMAAKFWPCTNPVGQSIVMGPSLGPQFEEGAAEIVGIVGNVREDLDQDPPPTMYQTPSQIPDAAMVLINGLQQDAFIVRTRPGVTPRSVSEAVQQALLIGNKLPATRTGTMDQAILASTGKQNFILLLLGLFAGAALALAAVGVYGVISYGVTQRTREIGVRVALGAQPGNVLRMVIREGMLLAGAGIVVGIAGALGLTRFLRSLLFEITPTDPATFAVVAAVLVIVALAACWIPARRAMKIEPMEALRYE